jgi:large subunit ribosomal protein L4
VQWKGGGRIHTPRPRKYDQHMPLKMRRAALRSALSVKAADAGLVLVDELTLEEPKTRLMAQSLELLVGDFSALILVPEKDENYETVMRSTNNIPDAKILLANYVNIRDILGYDKLIMPVKALDVLKSFLV